MKKDDFDTQLLQQPPSYSTPKEFLEWTTNKVKTADSIYQLVDSHLFPTSNIEDEYVVIILEIKNEVLREFYGGQYLVQHWTMKRKLFQAVYTCKPNNFYLYRQRFVYSLSGFEEEAQWIYCVSFYQEIFNKVKHPLFDKDNINGKHEIDLFVDGKQIFVINSARIMWAPLIFEREDQDHKDDSRKMSLSLSQSDMFDGEPPTLTNLPSLKALFPFAEVISLDVQFKSVLANVDGEAPEFMQIFDIGSEGYGSKEIHVLVETPTKIAVYSLITAKLRNMTVFKFKPTNIKFDKTEIEIGFQEQIQTAKMINISDSENIYVLIKQSGEIKLVGEKDIYKEGEFLPMNLNPCLAGVSSAIKEAIKVDEEIGLVQQQLDEDEDSGSDGEEQESIPGFNDDVMVKSLFLRRSYIYFEETQGHIQRIHINDCKLSHPLKRLQRQHVTLAEAQLQDMAIHLEIFNDYILANTALLISHAKILSIYDFKTQKWTHITPTDQGAQKYSEIPPAQRETYFGMPDDEVETIMLNHIFPSMVYDCFVQYKGSQLRRLKYYNEINKTCFEKRILFKDYIVHQIVKNNDMKSYRTSGFSVNRTFFYVQDMETYDFEIWVCENGMKITRLVHGIQEKWQILNIQTAPSDLLVIYQPSNKKLSFYNIEYSQQCLSSEELLKFKSLELPNFKPLESEDTKYFYFNQKLFYNQEGNLVQVNLISKNSQTLIQEYNFKQTIKDLQMLDDQTVYYKDKKNMFRYASLNIQNTFNIEQLPTKVIFCCGAFMQKIDYCLMTNRLALFTSPFEISIIPNLNKPSIDLMATMDFEDNFVCWRETERNLFAFKQPNVIVSWNLDTGMVLSSTKQTNIFLRDFKKHSEWNGTTLLKQQRDQHQDVEAIETEILKLREQKIMDPLEIDEERRARTDHPTKHLFSLVSINDDGSIEQMSRFIYDYRQGSTLYASFPYVLMMDEKSAKLYQLEGTGVFRNLKFLNNFFEPQMKVGKPLYFSPNFHHRIFHDGNSNEFILNYTLTNANLITLTGLRENLMYQTEDTHPMIYFHDDQNIVYLTNQGIEKLVHIKKKQKRRRTVTKLKEVSNCFYHKKAFARRFFYDLQNFNQNQGSSIQNIHLLQIRGDIIRRNLLLNEYVIAKSEDEHTNLKKQYQDKNLGNFNSFIIGNYRKEMTFSYLSWKIIEEIAHKKCSMMDFTDQFIYELCQTILPNQETMLHQLTNNFEEFLNFVRILDPKDDNKKKKSKLSMTDIPFLPNLQGITPLHISVAKNNTRFTDKIMYLLADTCFDHHSRFIAGELHKMIDQVPQALGHYLEKRTIQTNWLSKYSRGALETLEGSDFNIASNPLWIPTIDHKIKKKLFNEENLEIPLTMNIVDLPHMQKFNNKIADKFLEVISETDNIELYNASSVQAIVEIKWPLVKQAMIRKLFFPYCIFNIGFLIYTTFIFENLVQGAHESNGAEIGWDPYNPQFWILNQKHIFKVILLGLCAYFFILEFRQFVVQGPSKYFGSGWNYIDIIPLSLITFSMLFEYFFTMPEFERGMYAISSFFLWLKFLYFMRIFRAPSKFISIIVAVIADMKVFMCVFLIALTSFAQSLFILSNSNDPEKQFIDGMSGSILFTYCISLGSWDIENLGDSNKVLVLILFVLATVYLCVVMLNLLIAVVGDTYARVESSSSLEMYKNLADLIIENSFLVPQKKLDDHDKDGDYLYIAKLDNTQMSADTIEGQVHNLEQTLVKRTSSIEHASKELIRTFGNALHKVGEKHASIFLEENWKSETKFQQYLTTLENRHSPQRARLMSQSSIQSHLQEDTKKRGRGAAASGKKRTMQVVNEMQNEDDRQPFQ